MTPLFISNDINVKVDDRVTGWEFDQPEYFYVERGEGEIRRQLQEERINIR